MATIKELYQRAIDNAFLAADSLVENKDKALAYTAIAEALARTGLITDTVNKYETDDISKKTPQKITREDLKRKPQSAKIATGNAQKEVANSDVKSQQQDEIVEEEADSTEWTEELQEKLSAELDFIQEKVEEYGEENINEAVVGFSSGVIKEWTDLNPLNIKAFVVYLKALEQDAEGIPDEELPE